MCVCCCIIKLYRIYSILCTLKYKRTCRNRLWTQSRTALNKSPYAIAYTARRVIEKVLRFSTEDTMRCAYFARDFFFRSRNFRVKHLCDFNGNNLKSLSHFLFLLSHMLSRRVCLHFQCSFFFRLFLVFCFYVDICIKIKLSTNSIHNMCMGIFHYTY